MPKISALPQQPLASITADDLLLIVDMTADQTRAVTVADLQTAIGGAGGGTAASITNVPAGDIAATTVQAALNELDAEKLSKAGGTMTGAITLNTIAQTQPLQASSVGYVDGKFAGPAVVVGDAGKSPVLGADGKLHISTAPAGLVKSVNAVSPDANGNVVVSVTSTKTGLLANRPAVDADGTVYIVSGEVAPNDGLNGQGFIYSTGVAAWLEISGPGLGSSDARYVQLAGGTMLGALVLANDPVANLEAAPKQYVLAQDALRVSKAGDSMTGALTHTNAIGTATFASSVGNASHSLTANDTNSGLSASLSLTATQVLVNVNNIGKTEVFGGQVLVSDLNNLPVVPTNDKELTNKKYVDDQIAASVTNAAFLPKAGGTMTGAITLPGAPVDNLHAASKKYVDDTVAAAGGGAGAGYLPLTGGTVTGTISSTVSPTNDAHLTTKAYVDLQAGNRVAKAGDTMTGNLTMGGTTALSFGRRTAGLPTGDTEAYAAEMIRLYDSNGVAGAYSWSIGMGNAVAPDTGSWMWFSANRGPGSTLGGYRWYGRGAKFMELDGTGALKLYNTPTVNEHVVTKGYVDTKDTEVKAYVDQNDALRVAKTGDSMTGKLTLTATQLKFTGVEQPPNNTTYGGDRIRLYENTGTGVWHWGYGLDGNYMWASIDRAAVAANGTSGYKWYARDGELMRLDNAGQLSIFKAPASSNHVANKAYVDTAINNVADVEAAVWLGASVSPKGAWGVSAMTTRPAGSPNEYNVTTQINWNRYSYNGSIRAASQKVAAANDLSATSWVDQIGDHNLVGSALVVKDGVNAPLVLGPNKLYSHTFGSGNGMRTQVPLFAPYEGASTSGVTVDSPAGVGLIVVFGNSRAGVLGSNRRFVSIYDTTDAGITGNSNSDVFNNNALVICRSNTDRQGALKIKRGGVDLPLDIPFNSTLNACNVVGLRWVAGRIDLWINGTKSSVTAGIPAPAFKFNRVSIGDGLPVGNFFDGKISHAILYHTDIPTADDIDRVCLALSAQVKV